MPPGVDILEKKKQILEAPKLDVKFVEKLDFGLEESEIPKVVCLIEKTLIKDKTLDKNKYLNG